MGWAEDNGLTEKKKPEPSWAEANGLAAGARGDTLSSALPPFAPAKEKAEPGNPHQLGASMPGVVSEVKVKVGDKVERGDSLLVLEAMKMQVNVTSPLSATVRDVRVRQRDVVQAGDLLVVFQ